MNYRYSAFFTAILTLAFGLFGHAGLSSYTNVTEDHAFIESFSVAELPSSAAVQECRILQKTLPKAPAIAKVTPVGSPEYLFMCWMQRVHLETVFSGEDLTDEKDLYITCSSWKAHIEEKTVGTGFVNFMKEGQTYLVFLSGVTGGIEDDNGDILKLFQLQKDQYIAPVFSYGNHENTVYPTAGESTYVPYTEVADNEFFCTDEEGVAAFMELKNYLTQKYS